MSSLSAIAGWARRVLGKAAEAPNLWAPGWGPRAPQGEQNCHTIGIAYFDDVVTAAENALTPLDTSSSRDYSCRRGQSPAIPPEQSAHPGVRSSIAVDRAGRGEADAVSSRTRPFANPLFVGAIVLLATMVIAPRHGMAAIGDVLRTVTVGLAADCSPNIGTSVAIVQGPKVDLPQYPVLLVTSCFAGGGSASAKLKRSTLYFLDPATGNVVKSFQTKSGTSNFAPGNGWAQLVLAANKGVLFGCGDEGSLYSIDYISVPPNTVTDGALTLQTKPAAATACVGLAWDPSNNTIYQSIGGTIFHFDPTGAALPGSPAPPASFSAPGCTVNGLSVVGGVLLVACSGGGTVKRLDKLTGTLLSADPTLTFSATTLSDLECDPVTFGSAPFPSEVLGETVALWSKLAATDQVVAYRAPAGMCGLPPTATVLAPAACPPDLDPITLTPKYLNADGSPKDTDGDGLWDCWEDGNRWPDGKPGIAFANPLIRDLILCVNVDTDGDGIPDTTECANPLVKDVFVEIDWMQNADGTKSHKPDPLALFAVRNAFLAAPVDVPNGIRLHFLVDQVMPHVDLLSLEPCTGPPVAGAAVFDTLKKSFFGTATEQSNANTINAKLMAFRYMLFAHNLIGTNSSGCGEIVGDDSAITLASFGTADATGHRRGTTDQQAGTVMHELGHNLGLQHGGKDRFNCKPNYLSVMNYMFQFADFVTNRPLDYSPAALATLDEGGLLEANGLGTVVDFPFLNGEATVHGAPNTSTAVKALLGIHVDPNDPTKTVDFGYGVDWNNNGNTTDGAATADLNKLISAGCTGEGTVLESYNDWANLKYNARASLDFGSGVPPKENDKTAEHEQASFELADSDHDGTKDAFGCGSGVVPCAIDIKPGENPKVLNRSSESNIKVRIRNLQFPDGTFFDPPVQVLRETLTLNEVGVKLNNQNRGTCNSVTSTNGRLDLDCQFPASALPLGTNYSILEGKAVVAGKIQAFRARDVVTVVKQ